MIDKYSVAIYMYRANNIYAVLWSVGFISFFFLGKGEWSVFLMPLVFFLYTIRQRSGDRPSIFSEICVFIGNSAVGVIMVYGYYDFIFWSFTALQWQTTGFRS
jgi:hypothetical protein